MLALTALTIIYLDPNEPDRDWQAAYITVGSYALYSSFVYFLAARRSSLLKFIQPWIHWIDVACCTVLVGICTGTNRIFFFGFIFATLVASFRRGFAGGISVVLVSTVAYTVVGFSTETATGFESLGFDVYRFLARPIYLVVIGYLMAHWGGREISLKRRLALLKDITMSNPRFGVDRTINSTVERLREFYNADVGLLVTIDSRTKEHFLYRCVRENSKGSPRPEVISSELAGRLLALPGNLAVCHNAQAAKWRFWLSSFYAYDVVKGERVGEGNDTTNALANTLDVVSLISAPLFRHNEFSGRIYFSLQNKRFFEPSDVHFLLQVVEHVSPIIENIRLVDRMASDAAEQERQRIARDIHDSVIQPYIGFQIGLNGVRRKLATGHGDLGVEIDRLLEMTTLGITDLRRYIGGLKGPSGRETSLLPAIQRFTARFTDATGITVDVHAHNEIQTNDGLVAEAFQMVAEGLSNIRRHTEATHASVVVDCDEHTFILRIENDGVPGAEVAPFTPRSITDRALSLNGHTSVEQRPDGGTMVRIEIPL